MDFIADLLEDVLSGILEGNNLAKVTSFAILSEAKENSITYIPKNGDQQSLNETKASVVLVDKDSLLSRPPHITFIRVDHAKEAFDTLVEFHNRHLKPRKGIHPTAIIEPCAHIGKDCYIGPYVYIGENVRVGERTQIYAHGVIEKDTVVGDDCVFYPNVSVYRDCIIGNRVVLQSGCVIGSDGCRYTFISNGFKKIPQLGQVVIEDDVELGANTCVDRCVRGETIIRRNCIVGNLVQIGHDCKIGEYTQMSAQVGIAGNTTIGENCTFGGSAGVSSNLTVAPNTTAGGRATILSNVKKEYSVLLGTPAIDRHTFARASVVYKELPKMYTEFNGMKKDIEKLKEQNNKDR